MSENSFRIAAPALPKEPAGTESPAAALSSSILVPWVIALWILFLLSLALFSAGIANRAAIFYSMASLALFTLPGYFLTPILFGTSPEVRPIRAIVGALFGITLSSYASIVVGYLDGWNPKFIALAILGLTFVCGSLGRIFRGRLCLPVKQWTAADHAILAGLGILLACITARPALHVGQLTSHGYAYTWLYGFDFVYRADVIRAMTQHLPPDWSWMTGVPLRMYLVGYALPAFAYTAAGKTIALHSVLLLMTFFSSFILLACLYLFLRTLFSETRVLLFALFAALFAYSYYWFYDAAKAFLIGPNPGFRVYGSVSHHLHRMLLVEPQAALATSLLLIVLTLLALARYRLSNYALAVFLGVCLGASFGAEAMQGVMAVAWFGLFYGGRFLLRKSSLRDELGPFLAAALSCGLVCGSFFLLGMYQRSTSNLTPLGVNWWVVKFGLPYFLLDLGPLLLLGAWGILRWWRGAREDFGWPLLSLGAVVLLQVLVVLQRPAARMADRFLWLVLLPFAAYLFRELWSSPAKSLARSLVVGLALLSVPTFFTDIAFTSAINNVPETYYVAPEDMQACQWIRRNLPESAVIQGEYNYFAGPDRGLYMSLIASFAQRPQVLGWSTNAAFVVDNGVNLAKERRAAIEQAFGSGQLSSVAAFAQKYSVDYLYVGPLEQSKYPQLLPLLQSAPDRFTPVYSQSGVSVFRLLPAGSAR